MFRTEFEIPKISALKLTDRILTIGSCFSDTIGEKLRLHKFDVQVNPFGTIYNPCSIHKVLRYVIHNSMVPPETFLKNNDIFYNYDFHSSLSSLSQKDLQEGLREKIGALHYLLKDAKWLLITYGTSFVYERVDSGELVANCHKMPAREFHRYMLSQKRILEDFQIFHEELQKFNSEIQIILTLSPVRHVKDTIPLNSVSKAVLRLACHTLDETYKNVSYFPAYELLLDDLRDYRFYGADLVHPSEVAEEYIWEKFTGAYLDQDAGEFIKEWESILAAMNHRPFQPLSSSHQKFLRGTLARLEKLANTVNVGSEIEAIKKQII